VRGAISHEALAETDIESRKKGRRNVPSQDSLKSKDEPRVKKLKDVGKRVCKTAGGRGKRQQKDTRAAKSLCKVYFCDKMLTRRGNRME